MNGSNPKLDKAIEAATELASQLNGADVATCASPPRCAAETRKRGMGDAHKLCTPCQAHRHACEVERLLRLVRKRERAAEAHYVVATLSEARALRPGRPFRAPHYTCSTRALREETLLAEGGVLYLDQLEDWRRGALAEVTDAPLLGVVVAFAAPAADLDRWNRNADAVREALSRVHECFASGCTAVATTGERAPLSRGRGEVVYHWCPAHAPSSKATS